MKIILSFIICFVIVFLITFFVGDGFTIKEKIIISLGITVFIFVVGFLLISIKK